MYQKNRQPDDFLHILRLKLMILPFACCKSRETYSN